MVHKVTSAISTHFSLSLRVLFQKKKKNPQSSHKIWTGTLTKLPNIRDLKFAGWKFQNDF